MENSDLNLFVHSDGICIGREIYMASECLGSSNSLFLETLDYFSFWGLALGLQNTIIYLCYGGKM